MHKIQYSIQLFTLTVKFLYVNILLVNYYSCLINPQTVLVIANNGLQNENT